MSIFHLPLAPLASTFIIVEGVAVFVDRVVSQVHEALVLQVVSMRGNPIYSIER